MGKILRVQGLRIAMVITALFFFVEQDNEVQAGPSRLWGPVGVPVTTAAGNQSRAATVSDGAGGVIWVWSDDRLSPGTPDIFGQRLNPSGARLWPAEGVSIASASDNFGTPAFQDNASVIADGAGGAILVWEDFRSLQIDIYAQRIDSNGVTQWQVNGVPISTACWQFGGCGNHKRNPHITADGSGGAVITWWEARDGLNLSVWAQRVNANGLPLWTKDGVPVTTGPFYAFVPKIVSDGAGGVIVVWQDFREGVKIFAQRLDPNGNPMWLVNGNEISSPIGQVGLPGHAVISDGAGGAIIVWVDRRDGTDSNVYAQRINGAGQKLWQTGGVPVNTNPLEQYSPVLVSDGAGGAIIAWEDQGASPPGSGQSWIFAQRVSALGVPVWMTNGIPIYTVHGFAPQIVIDGSGGAIIVWDGLRVSEGGFAGPSIYAQRISGAGDVLWDVNGFEVYHQPNGNYGFAPQVISDGGRGAVVYWTDYRLSGGGAWDIFAQRVTDTLIVNCAADSLQFAVNIAVPGITILVDGTCNENVLVRNDKVRLVLDGGGTATINGLDPNKPTLDIRGKAILVDGFTILATSNGIEVQRGSNVVINNNIIDSVGDHGVVVNQLGFAVLTNNTIQNNGGDGVVVKERAAARIGFNSGSELSPSSNTIQMNSGNGITVAGSSSARVVGNAINNNGGHGVGVMGGAQADLSENSINNNGGDGINLTQNSSVQLGEDPGLFAPANSGAGNGGFGISCDFGGALDGLVGTLTGNMSQTNIDASCLNSLSP